jgi:hypothetical protein
MSEFIDQEAVERFLEENLAPEAEEKRETSSKKSK